MELFAPSSSSLARTLLVGLLPPGNERAPAVRRATEHTRRQPKLSLDHVVDEIVRYVQIEPGCRIHRLRLLALDLDRHAVSSLACTSKDDVHRRSE